MTLLNTPTSAPNVPPLAFTGIPSGRVPAFLRTVVAEQCPASRREVAEQAVLTLNTSMMTIYDEALAHYKQNMRDHAPDHPGAVQRRGRPDDPLSPRP